MPDPSPPRVLFLFVDGIGLGTEDPETNPFARFQLPGFERLLGGAPWIGSTPSIDEPNRLFQPLSATLGHDGLPQSGTGQATLFTGVDCIEMAGRHFGPYPHSQTKSALASSSIFKRVKRHFPHQNAPAAFANAYPPRFFRFARSRDRWTVTTHCCVEADIHLRSTDDLRQNEALAADITRKGWARIGIDVPEVDEAEAAHHLHELALKCHFTAFEYYLTDKAGHSQSMERAEEVLRSLDRFLAALHEEMDPEEILFVLSSDHGNLEDLSRKVHTRNAVPLLAYGRGAHHFRRAQTIADVVPAIMRVFAG